MLRTVATAVTIAAALIPLAASDAAAYGGHPLTRQMLDDIVAGATAVRVTANDNTSRGAVSKTAYVREKKEVVAILAALGRTRAPTVRTPRCQTPYRLSFLDAGGKEIATVGLCDSARVARAQRSAARIEARRAMAGFQVEDLAALRRALKPHGIDLP
jgi:hypothetical protein